MEYRTEEKKVEMKEEQRQQEPTAAEIDSSWEWLLEENIHRDLDKDEEDEAFWQQFLNGGGDA